MGIYKYDIVNIEWQEFELLSFKCLQIDISKSITYIEGGNDKGREFIYKGNTSFFTENNKELTYIFQAKHKSTLDFKALKNDLKNELEKVYLKNELVSDIYCLVTNISLSGNQNDELHLIFNDFIQENNLSYDLDFKIYGYRHLESCLDTNNSLKILFPSIIKNTDFKLLLEDIINRNSTINSDSFIKLFYRNKAKFVTTSVFEEALSKINRNNILLLSGPPKSGKTFTAEMVIFNKYCTEEFIPYNIISIDDFNSAYDKSKKQVFLFDDTFGKYNIDLNRADIINRKIDYIFDLIDDNHKCLFTSREYIFRAFVNYASKEVKEFIQKINVDVYKLNKYEKESIFSKYYKLSTNQKEVTTNISSLLDHENFTPEVIRSYFEINQGYNYLEFVNHLNFPDEYLKKIYTNLSEDKKILLLSILLSSNRKADSISYSHNNICDDLNKPKRLINIYEELELLSDSLIKTFGEKYLFYHPTMFEFFVRYIDSDASSYRTILFKNINVDLLLISNFKKRSDKNIEISSNDIHDLIIGFKRYIFSPKVNVSNLNGMFAWLNDNDKLINFQLKYKDLFKELCDSIVNALGEFDLNVIADSNEDFLGIFFKSVKRVNFKNHIINREVFNKKDLELILTKNKNKERFWYLVFNLIPFLEDDIVFNEKYLGRDWLNLFYSELRDEINKLGNELFGNAYPNFETVREYEKLIEEKSFEKARKFSKKSIADYKIGTNKTWYKRYSLCKEKMMTIKAAQPHGYKIYNLLVPAFSPLSLLEENQKNRYIFNKKRNGGNY